MTRKLIPLRESSNPVSHTLSASNPEGFETKSMSRTVNRSAEQAGNCAQEYRPVTDHNPSAQTPEFRGTLCSQLLKTTAAPFLVLGIEPPEDPSTLPPGEPPARTRSGTSMVSSTAAFVFVSTPAKKRLSMAAGLRWCDAQLMVPWRLWSAGQLGPVVPVCAGKARRG